MPAAGNRESSHSPLYYVMIALLVGTWFSYWSVRTARQADRSLDHDFGVYYRAGEALWSGGDPYHLDRGPLLTFKYAPVVAVCFMPLASLEPVAARVLWCWIDCLAILGVVWISLDLAAVPKGRWKNVSLLVGMLVLGHVVAELHAGQTTSVWLLLLLSAYWFMKRDRPALAGICLAASILVKLVPIALVPYYLWTRRPLFGLGWLGVGLVCLLLLPAMFLGWDRHVELLVDWPSHVFDTTTIHQATRIQNQSVLAQIARWSGVGQAEGWSLASAQRLWLILSLVGGAGLYGWLGWRRGMPAIARVALVLIYMTAFNPLAWRYNFLALVPAYVYVGWSLYIHEFAWVKRFLLMVLSSVILTVPCPDALYAAGGRLWGLLMVVYAIALTLSAGEAAEVTRRRRSYGRETFASRGNSLREGGLLVGEPGIVR
jgi:hypothetical protein